ncbi:MAG: WYL domain-containing protein [Thermomicrobiales bacterium]
MRADRLISILLLMQARDRVTAADLAAELGISLATARRDLEALSLAGVPVYAQPGRNGGWSLVGGARTDLTGLTSDEANALFLLLGPASNTNDATQSALRKLLQALPTPFREEAARAAQATVIDRAMWDHREDHEPPFLKTVQTAIVQRRQLRIGYANRTGERSSRTVHPLGTIRKGRIWYLIARTDAGERTFRIDRINKAELTALPADMPDGFDLGSAWERTVEEVERQRATTTARIRVPARFAEVLRDRFGAQLHIPASAPHPDGTIDLLVSAPEPFMLASQLAGWGKMVTVLEPESVRAELARIGRELVEANEPDRTNGLPDPLP